MPELPYPVSGEIIDTAAFGVPVVDRVTSRYANAAARDSASPTPGQGELCYVQDVNQLQVYTGSSWWTVGSPTATIIDLNPTTAENLWISVNGGIATLTASVQSAAVGIVAADPIPAEYRPTTGPIRVALPAFTSGFGTRPGQFYTARVNNSGTFEIQAVDPGNTASDRLMGAVSWAIGARGV